MKALGFRAEKDKIHWALVEGTVGAPVLRRHDKFNAPTGYTEAEVLSHFRTKIQTLIVQHAPDRVAARLSETFLKAKPKPNVLESMFQRARIEGVILEVACSAGLEVRAGAMALIRAGLGSKSAKAYLGEDELRGLDWSAIRNENMREAIIVAAAALETE